MKIVLTQDYGKLGSANDVVTVKDGYARNFLIPNGIAAIATKGNLRAVEENKKFAEKREANKANEAKNLASKIADTPCTITAKAKNDEELFGSVTAADIANFLDKEGFKINKGAVLLSEPIKKLGVFPVKIQLHKDVSVELKVWIVKEEEK